MQSSILYPAMDLHYVHVILANQDLCSLWQGCCKHLEVDVLRNNKKAPDRRRAYLSTE